jgi:hypothetical protein
VPAKGKVRVPVSAVEAASSLVVKKTGDTVGFTIENSAFQADHTLRTVRGAVEDSGTLRGLLLKAFGVRLERDENRMHWAPSFQRVGARGYSSIAMWTPVQKHSVSATPGHAVFAREGHHADYPEISIRSEYEYFAHVPYFLFRAELTVTRAMEMWWLRGQEMTMDGLFTHAAFPDATSGRPMVIDFSAKRPSLAVDLPWIAFVNLEKGYGLGAVVLGYTASQIANPLMSINDGARGGKYWDRRVINQTAVGLKPGDKFTESTAYVVFRVADAGNPMREFLDWERRIRNPLRARLE